MRAGRRWRRYCRTGRRDVELSLLLLELVGLVRFTELVERGRKHDVVDTDVSLVLVPEFTERLR